MGIKERQRLAHRYLPIGGFIGERAAVPKKGTTARCFSRDDEFVQDMLAVGDTPLSVR